MDFWLDKEQKAADGFWPQEEKSKEKN